MKTAFVVMTIMGCDDTVTQCNYLETIDRTWTSIALCDAQAEELMARVQDENYPVIVAVCESADDRVTMDMAGQHADSPSAAVPSPGRHPPAHEAEEARRGLAARALSIVKRAMPDGAALKTAVSAPVRIIEGSYTWIVRRFTD